jgi:hypothetical protein
MDDEPARLVQDDDVGVGMENGDGDVFRRRNRGRLVFLPRERDVFARPELI